jgi:hypothetical protein
MNVLAEELMLSDTERDQLLEWLGYVPLRRKARSHHLRRRSLALPT